MDKKRFFQLETKKNLVILFLCLLIINLFISKTVANGSDDNGVGKDFGWAALGLLSLAILYVIIYQLFINSRKILPKNDKFEKRRDNIKKIYLKSKKPLSKLHYFAAFIAIIVLLIHGAFLISNRNEAIIPGLIAGGLYIFFAIIGILIKVVLKKPKKAIKLKKNFFKIHTSIIIFIVIVAFTITHIILAD